MDRPGRLATLMLCPSDASPEGLKLKLVGAAANPTPAGAVSA